jgi:hypothetical protein
MSRRSFATLRLATMIAGTLLCMPVLDAASPGRLTEPFTLTDDFEGDGLGQWASYPPAQDVGYDPSLAPTTDYQPEGGRAIMRVWQPVRDGRLRLGFIKHVPFTASTGLHIALRFRLEPSAGYAKVEVALAGAEGDRYVGRVAAASDRWQFVALDAGAFRSDAGNALSAGTSIEAVSIVAILPTARQSITYRFLLDDVAIRANRVAQFTLMGPAVERITPWSEVMAQRSYGTGDAIDIAATAPMPLQSVSCDLFDREERPVATVALQRRKDAWSTSAYRLPADAAPGIWRARLRGTAADGRTMETTMRFRVRRASALGHPRLYFDARGEAEMRKRTEHPRLRELWTNLQKSALQTRTTGDLSKAGLVFGELDSRYLLPSLPGYFDALNRARLRIASNALDGFVTGDSASRETARTALLQVAGWPAWAPPWFEAHGQHTYYPAGQLSSAVALAYDVLYPDLTDADRAIVRRALFERSILPAYREYVLDNRVTSHTSNWIAHAVGGALIAAAAIDGDGTPQQQAALETPLAGLLQKIESHMNAGFLPDGSYGEGISYQEFDLETLGPMIVALDRVFGIDYWTRTHVGDSLAYPIHTLASPVEDSLDMGDTHPPSGHGIAAIAYRSPDPIVRWYASRFELRTIEDFIFFDDRVAPREPSDDGSRVFEKKGSVVFRTGWRDTDTILLFRAGPTFNHNHADQGSFLLNAFGERLVTEAGWSDYYKDPYYATYFSQAAGHNTLLVDRNAQSQTVADTAQFTAFDAHPRITAALTSPFYDSVTADLAPVYDGRLSHYTRRIVFIKPAVVLVFDEAAADRPATFDWLLHVPDASAVRAGEQTATYAGEHGALGLRWLTSASSTMEVKKGHLPYGVFATSTPAIPPPQPGYFDLAMRAAQPRAQFLVALAPAATRATAESVTRAMRRLGGPGALGLVWPTDEATVWSVFRTGEGVMRHGAWTIDADAATIREAGGRVTMVAMENGRSVSRDGARQLGVSRPVSAAVRYRDDAIDVTVDAPEAATLFLRTPSPAERITIDGKAAIQDTVASAGEQPVAVAAGRHTIAVELR